MWKDRTKALVGEAGIEKLSKSHVCVVGLGGVGGYVCSMLVRAGVENLTIVDFDKVDETNINRQIVANVETVEKFKTDAIKEMLLKINPNCNIKVFNERFNIAMADTLFTDNFDYVVDAIDSVQDKIDLICYCKSKSINIISAMGAGNRKNIPKFEVMDIYKTFNDGLAKVMRKKLRERQIASLDVVTCFEKAEKIDENFIGSISYYPAMCGCVLSAFVINKLLEKE